MKIAIVGAGISGLSAAHFILKKNPDCEITIFERNDRVGGNIR
ncbi:MAG: FAD-dependent oxidoreductase, partial [Calditrichaeota bacterium]|nr:FAD-dependent oxidoreductase [Calditrichota bacterium]